ncbi:MAG TPA: Hpt domain-containing protein, partial [Cellvibrio sp.]|nr:Hpt domain-containing protein [Cellvibrio sp.]
MADNRNFAALDWLIHEIGETLKEARQSLEAFVENPKDTARIRFCLTHIHQVHGSLQMVEFYGAAMLAEEMEKLTQAMINNAVANPAEAQEVLMRAILQFPVYLDQVKATRRDNPLVVLPLLNDLRAVRGESLLTDTKLFVPNLAPAKRISGMRLPVTQDNQQFQEMVKKLRQMYQYAAAGFIRGVNPDENLGYLQKVFSRLHKLTQGTARAPLWDICLALAEALQIDAIEISVSIKNLLRQLDKEIKVLSVHGVKALDAFTQDELIKNLLYYVARSGKHAPGFPPNSHLQRIYQGYQLEAALLEGKEVGDEAQNMLSAPDPEAMRSVVEALKGELDVIKHALDICLSGGDTRSALSDALPVVKRVADTMAVLGIGELRKQVLEQGAVLEMVVEANSQLSNDQLMSVAGKVIEIEDALDHLASQSSQANRSGEDADITLSRAKESVLRESRNGLEHAKDAIIEYIASQWDRAHLQAVPETLREIRGGLEIMPLPRPARILGACARYIEEQLLQQDEVPQWNNLDTLADAITSVEYYLERLSSGARKEENDLLLSVAEESVASLGYAVAKMPRPEPKSFDEGDRAPMVDMGETPLAETAPDVSGVESPDVGYVKLPDVESPDITQESDEDTAALLAAYQAALEPDISTNSTAVMTEETTAELEQEEITVDEWALPEEDPAEPTPTQEPVAEQESAAEEFINYSSTAENIADDDDDDLDDEIIDIFVEEAGEVTQTIGEYFPQWAQNFNDAESLTEFRRAFHTLKGSGRMVGANDIGELAWSIENMLNRIIDGTVTPSDPHVAIIEKVRLLLPGMINAFSLHQPNPEPELTAAYRTQAEALAKGMVPPELNDAPTTAETIPEAEIPEALDVESDDVEITLETIAAELEPENGELPQPEEITYASFIDATTDEESAESHIDDEEVIDYDSLSSPGTNALDGYLIEEDSSEVDDPLWDIFGAEALSHLEVVQNYIQRMEEQAPFYDPPSEHMQRALHTLKGSAHMAEITPVAELATPLEKFVKELRSYQVNINDDILQLLRDAVSYTHIALDNINHNEPIEIPRLQQFLARVHELREIHVAPLARQQEADANGKRPIDPELLSIFMAEEMNLLLNADQIIEHWREAPNDLQQLNPLINELRNLTHGAAHAYLPPMATLGEKLQAVY